MDKDLEEQFNHIGKAQVSLAKASMHFLDVGYLEQPDFSSVLRNALAARDDINKLIEALDQS